jgi:multiple sugar transport system permease protein
MRKYSVNRNQHLYFILPAIIVMVALMVVPFFFSAYITLFNVNLLENGGAFVFAGFDNFKTFFVDPRVHNALGVTTLFLLAVLTSETVVGTMISMFLDRKFRFKAAYRALLIIPMFMTPVVSGLIWRTFYDPNNGIANWLLHMFHIPPVDWLGSVKFALMSLTIVDLWQWTPFMVLLIMASLDSISEDLYEAARVEGANEIQTVFTIKLPLIVPTILIAMIMRAIDAIKAFDIIYVMTKGGPGIVTETINMYAYTVGFKYFRIGYATTISFIFTIIVTMLLNKLFAKTQSI